MSDDLIVFLRARLAEDEAVARAATAGPWSVDSPVYAEAITAADGVSVVAGGRWGGEASVFESTEDAVHIARHDPARVLAEVESKRAQLDEHQDTNDGDCGTCVTGQWGYPTHGGSTPQPWPCQTLRLLAAPYAAHPDYRPGWAPTA